MKRLSFFVTVLLMLLLVFGAFNISIPIMLWLNLPSWTSSAFGATVVILALSFAAYFGPTKFDTLFTLTTQLSKRDKFIFSLDILFYAIAPFFEGYFLRDLSRGTATLLIIGNTLVAFIGVWALGSANLRKVFWQGSKPKDNDADTVSQ